MRGEGEGGPWRAGSAHGDSPRSSPTEGEPTPTALRMDASECALGVPALGGPGGLEPCRPPPQNLAHKVLSTRGQWRKHHPCVCAQRHTHTTEAGRPSLPPGHGACPRLAPTRPRSQPGTGGCQGGHGPTAEPHLILAGGQLCAPLARSPGACRPGKRLQGFGETGGGGQWGRQSCHSEMARVRASLYL